ncbi:HAAS signaling domain-containing protein [Ornithinibacillus halophilus]|uniref:Uncharacterized protein n=1 Tax=Ornithinibacillus halophilus TaxID=930117 RepID=A0A1M5DTT7_9BACI|nr:permease prefix domain 1-containing protein [Ornithinibacillus halophilus]SHF70407.1 hypothetical protein SAMN05216225_10034 [Ornithinibacillus halophilus]
MEIINRYVYAVVRRLPQKQRDDIANELRVLVEDMVEERTQEGVSTDEIVEEVLMELGSPKQLADKYRGSKRYLIGPDYFESYFSINKIVLLAVSIALGVVFAIETIINPLEILDHFIGLIVSIFTIVPSSIGWITIVFVLIEHLGVIKGEDVNLEKDWHPSNLPPVPNEKKQIKQSEPIFGIIFLIFLIVAFTVSNQYIGVYLVNDNEFSTIPFFHKGSLSAYLPIIVIVLGLLIMKEIFKLVLGRWTIKLAFYNLITNVITFAFVGWIMVNSSVWNPNFMDEMVQAGIVESGSEGYQAIKLIWEIGTQWTIIIFMLSLLWDVGVGFFKARKK